VVAVHSQNAALTPVGRIVQFKSVIDSAETNYDHALTTGNYIGAFDWSPDGVWLAAPNAATIRIDIINATSGQVLPLSLTYGLPPPTWRPTVSPISSDL
jgi:hypothetical protein